MKKNLISGLIILLICFGLSGCGKREKVYGWWWPEEQTHNLSIWHGYNKGISFTREPSHPIFHFNGDNDQISIKQEFIDEYHEQQGWLIIQLKKGEDDPRNLTDN